MRTGGAKKLPLLVIVRLVRARKMLSGEVRRKYVDDKWNVLQ